MNYTEKLDFALSFFIGCENVDKIEECKNEGEIEEYLIHEENYKKVTCANNQVISNEKS